MHVTVYEGARAPEPIAQDDLTWPDFCDEIELMAQIEYPDKIGMLAFAPHQLTTPYRKLENVAEVTALVIDVDRCELAPLFARLEALAEDGCASLVYTSPSDDPAGPVDARRVRVVAPVSRPIAVAECARTRFAFAEALGLMPGQGVEGAKDAAKLFFVGRLEGTAPREVWRFGE